MSRRLELSEEEFLEIEEAMSATARGRAFLRERDRRSRAVAVDDVKRYVRTLKESLRGSAPADMPQVRILQKELQEMSSYIQQTRAEIAALKPDDAASNRIMAATGELDAIVTATERATSEILNATEHIQKLIDRLSREDAQTIDIARDIEAQITEILTACSFQDITGQRTTKVVNTLRYIEHRVNAMIEIWGTGEGTARGRSVELAPVDTRPDAHLLNGPALEGGVSQDDVDAMFGFAPAAAPASGADASQDDIDRIFA